MSESLRSKTRGCLLAVAVGDALGAPVEGLTARQIRQRYGSVRDYLPERYGPGVWTDDTQLTLELARSLASRGRFDPEDFAARLVAWLPRARGAGFACATAVARLSSGLSWREAGVDSAGCGTAMRSAPLGLFHRLDDEATLADAQLSSHLTHTDGRAKAMAAAVALAVARQLVPECPGPKELFEEIASLVGPVDGRAGRALAGLVPLMDRPLHEALEATGVGGFVMETVPAAFLVFAHFPDSLEEALVAAVAAGGDTDSIASIVGALAGAASGREAIPARWLQGLHEPEEIEAAADELYRAAEAKEASHAG